MSDNFETLHDQARYAYEGRTNYGIVRAENGGIRMSDAHHSDGWEMGFLDGWKAGERLADLARAAQLLDAAKSFRTAWEQWGKVADLEQAEVFERKARAIATSSDAGSES